MNEFAEAMRESTNEAFTENGAITKRETLNWVLDFFSKSGALRGQEAEAIRLFVSALSEDESLAMKSLFYARDIRGGQGERDIFRSILNYMANKSAYQNVIKRNIPHIPEYGRWDDLYALFDTPLEKNALEMIATQFKEDKKNLSDGKPISLLAKWMKSSNTSSKESRRLAKKTIEYLNITEREYRKTLSVLRKEIDVVEKKISAKQFGEIDYSKVPSQASRIYSKAFHKNDEDRYTKFIADVESGKETINAGTLYPYQIVNNIRFKTDKEKRVLDTLWNALPNYAEKQENSLCVVDTSGSMTMGYSNIAPIEVAVSLGIYMAERIEGPFNGYFMTFSEHPTMQKIAGKTIFEKYESVRKSNWGFNTNFNAVFKALLKTAIKKNVPQKDMIKKLYIISDMQFDEAFEDGVSIDNIEKIKKMYFEAGYEMPELVFWNVNASSNTPVTKDERGMYLVSGCSPSILKHAIDCEATTPEELMLEVLNSERYKPIS